MWRKITKVVLFILEKLYKLPGDQKVATPAVTLMMQLSVFSFMGNANAL